MVASTIAHCRGRNVRVAEVPGPMTCACSYIVCPAGTRSLRCAATRSRV